jgi:MFS family permease
MPQSLLIGQGQNMTSFNELASVAIASAFGVGMVMAILQAVKAPLSERISESEVRVGSWLDALKIGLVPLTFLTGILVDHAGARWTIIAGSLILGLAFFGLALSRNFRACAFALLLIGLGTSTLGIGVIVLMPKAFFGNNAASANLGFLFFPLGALVTSSLGDVFIQKLGYRQALSLLAVVALMPALLATLSPAAAYPLSGRPEGLATLLADPFLWLTGLVFLLYAPLEGAVGTWANSYLSNLGFSERQARGLETGFWMIFIASRLVAAAGLHAVNHDAEPWALLGLAILAAVALGILVSSHQRHQGGWGLLLVAAVLGPIFPTLVGIIFKNFDESELGTAYGITFAIGGIGSLCFPAVMTAYTRRTSIRAALRFPTVVAVLLAGTSLVLALAR